MTREEIENQARKTVPEHLYYEFVDSMSEYTDYELLTFMGKFENRQRRKVKHLVAAFKQFYIKHTGEPLDFRAAVYALNNYGANPQGNVTEREIDLLYMWANSFGDLFKYNTKMALDELRTGTYKNMVYDVCERINAHSQSV